MAMVPCFASRQGMTYQSFRWPIATHCWLSERFYILLRLPASARTVIISSISFGCDRGGGGGGSSSSSRFKGGSKSFACDSSCAGADGEGWCPRARLPGSHQL